MIVNDPLDFATWHDDWTADEYNDCPDRSNSEDLQEAFEAGYKLAAERSVTVYIAREVIAHEYDMVLGVFSTRELADAAVDARKKLDRAKWVDEWPVDEAQLDTDLTRL